MARIPNATDIRRVNPSGARPIARFDTSNVGGGLDSMANTLAREAEKITKSQLADAEIEFLLKKTEQDNAYTDDQEFSTISERYGKAMDEAISGAASKISDGRAREAFLQRNALRLAEGSERIKAVAREKEKEHELGKLIEQQDGLREAAITGDIQGALDAYNARLEALQAREFLDENQVAQMKIEARDDFAVARLNSYDPKMRYKALKQDWAKNLPSDVYAKLERETKRQLEAEVATEDVDAYFEANPDAELGDALTWAKENIDDHEIRMHAEQRILANRNAAKAAEADKQYDLSNTYYRDIIDGNITTMAQIQTDHREDFDQMSTSTIKTLQQAFVDKAGAGRVVSNDKVYANLAALEANKDWVKLRNMTLEAKSKSLLSQANFEDFIDAAEKGIAGQDAGKISNARQYINDTLDVLEIDDDIIKGKIQAGWTNYQDYIVASTGKPATQKDLEAYTNTMLEKSVTSDGFLGLSFLGGESKYRIEMTPDELEGVIAAAGQDPDSKWAVEATLAQYKELSRKAKRPITPTREEFLIAVYRLRDAEAAKEGRIDLDAPPTPKTPPPPPDVVGFWRYD